MQLWEKNRKNSAKKAESRIDNFHEKRKETNLVNAINSKKK